MFILANIEKKRNLTGHCGVYWKNRGIFRIGTPGCAPPKNIQRTREGGMEPETDEKNASDIVSSKSLEKKKRIKKKYNIYIYSSLAGCCFFIVIS